MGDKQGPNLGLEATLKICVYFIFWAKIIWPIIWIQWKFYASDSITMNTA